MTDYLTPEGRIVGGHPMIATQSTDDNDNPKTFADGTPIMNTFLYFALPKAGSTDWKQTALGSVLTAEANSAFKPNEVAAPDFSWKVIDGDSSAPMRGGKPAPNTREGWPGHWVLRLSSNFGIKCFHEGKFDPMQQIQDKNEIKCGDYCRVYIEIAPNNKTGYKKTNGLYLNPKMLSVTRAGQVIVTESGPSAADVFGGGSAPAPQAAPPAPAPAAAPPPPPHNPLPKTYTVNGVAYTREQLIGYGWTAAQIDAL